jgi:hypothetical protein
MKRRATIDLSSGDHRTTSVVRTVLCGVLALAMTVVTLGLQTTQASATALGDTAK